MDVDKLPRLSPPDFGNVRDARRPTLSFSWRMDGPHRAAAHGHPRAHIIQPEHGAYWVAVPEGRWLVPAGQAAWIPSHVYHEVYSHGAVTARMIFVDESYAVWLPKSCGTVMLSSLLSELIARAIEYGNDYPHDGAAVRLARVMLDELSAMTFAPLLVPVSNDPRLSRAMGHLMETAASDIGLEQLGRVAGASQRTLARLFRNETGMTFRQWKTRMRLVDSIDRLSRGASVTEVAADLGYGRASSFAYMFPGNMGVSPGRYRPGAGQRRSERSRASTEAREPNRSRR